MRSLEKLGSKKHPICVSVWDEEAAGRIAKVCDEKGWHFIAKLDPEEDEDIEEFILKCGYEQMRSAAPQQAQANFDPKPNNYCPCGSNKKYKKCCMLSAQRTRQLPPPEIRSAT